MADPSEGNCAARQEPTTMESTHSTSQECIAMNTGSKTPLAVLEHPAVLEQSGMESEEIEQGPDIRTPVELLQPAPSLQLEGIGEDSSSRERIQECSSPEKSEPGLYTVPEIVSREDTEHGLRTGSESIGKEHPEYTNTETQLDDHRTSAAETVEKCLVKEAEASVTTDNDSGGEPPEESKELEEHMETGTTVQHQYVQTHFPRSCIFWTTLYVVEMN